MPTHISLSICTIRGQIGGLFRCNTSVIHFMGAVAMNSNGNEDFRILALDGGGSKGVYSLGFLRELERLTDVELYKCFDLIYGTSTGAIIAALISLGKKIEEIIALYLSAIPDIMETYRKSSRSRKLEKHARDIFGDAKFDACRVNIGIVAMHYGYAKPMIFKSSIMQQAHGRHSTFEPGFGCKIADAILASCAAFPYFEKVTVKTVNQGNPELIDGGFVGNNPALFALADAVKAFEIPLDAIKMLSVGVGEYPQAPRGFYDRILRNRWPYNLFEKMLSANTNTVEQLRQVLFPNVQVIRVNDSFTDVQYATNLLESHPDKLSKMMELGRASFGKYEDDVKRLFNF